MPTTVKIKVQQKLVVYEVLARLAEIFIPVRSRFSTETVSFKFGLSVILHLET